MQLHVEWAAPAQVRGNSQNRGNSGIFLQGRYEVQVLDSSDNLTYADGQAGAIYGQWPPLVNATRKPGEWQTYDIVFEAPRFEGYASFVKPAALTVFLNGVLLHNRRELGPTVHRELRNYAPQPEEDSLVLQDHQQPVRYRNIWIRQSRLRQVGYSSFLPFSVCFPDHQLQSGPGLVNGTDLHVHQSERKRDLTDHVLGDVRGHA